MPSSSCAYRGRIDDAYAARLKRNWQVKSRDLADALDAVLAGKPVANPVTQPVGCPIEKMDAKPATDGAVTFHRDIEPILQAHCQTCHRPGEVGPFSLLTYQQAKKWADDIKAYTQSKQMPPWLPVGGPGFRGERSSPTRRSPRWRPGPMPAHPKAMRTMLHRR